MAGWAVFLSYVEATHDVETKALKAALDAAGIPTFRFKEDVPSGEPFGPVLADALLGSQVVVAFLDATFLERPNCRWELNAVLAAADLEARLVIVRPVSDSIPNGLAGVPPVVANRRWPRANETADLVALVEERLAANPPTLAEALGESSASELRDLMLETSVLPAPELLTDIPHAPDPLPASIEDAFVGRSETLWRMDHALRLHHGLGTRVRSTVALESGGGTGKTRLAREYVRRYGSHYRGGIYWIDGTGRVDEQLHAVLRVLDPAVPDLVELRKIGIDLAGYLRRKFETHRPTEPVLWVVDGVPEASLRKRRPKKAPSLESWCPLRGEVALLLTSRVMVSAVSPSIEPIPVDLLPAPDAVALLKRSVDGAGLPGEQWQAIADWVGRLPLALSLLNSALAAGTLAAAELASRADSHNAMTSLIDATMASLRKAGLAGLEPGALRGVSEAFAISYDLLDDEAQLFLRLLAQLAPDPIPEALVDSLGPETATPATRTTLRTRSFVEPAPRQDAPVFGQIHVLLADFIRTAHPASSAELGLLGKTMADLFDPHIVELPASWPLLNALVPHADAICARVSGTGDAAKMRLRVMARMATALLAQGLYARARHLDERVFEARSSLLGADHPSTLASASNLAITLSMLGEYTAARALQQEAFERWTRLLGADHPDTLTAEDRLANTLSSLGDYAAARAHEERVIEARTRLLGDEHRDTLGGKLNLASTLGKQGHYAAARELQKLVLETWARLLGDEHPETLDTRNNLANTLSDLGDYAGARAHQERVFEARARLLGAEHPETLAAANNLANTLSSLGDYAGARAHQERTLEAATRLLGTEHPFTLAAENNLANTLRIQGDYAAARMFQERALADRTRLLGDEHPDTLRAANNLAITLWSLGDYASARALQERAIEVGTRLLGDEHPDTLRAQYNLANTLSSLGDYAAARTLQERVVEGLVRQLGADHPETLMAQDNLAGTLSSLGDHMAARALRERVVEGLVRLLGADHPETLMAQDNLAKTLSRLGDDDAARALREGTVEARARLLRVEHPDTPVAATDSPI